MCVDFLELRGHANTFYSIVQVLPGVKTILTTTKSVTILASAVSKQTRKGAIFDQEKQ